MVPEGGAPTDAASDAPDGGHWCASQTATFCADFDEVTDIAAVENSWSGYTLLGGAFSLDTGPNVPSPPNALKVATSATSNVDTLLLRDASPPPGPGEQGEARLLSGGRQCRQHWSALGGCVRGHHLRHGRHRVGRRANARKRPEEMSALYSEGPDAGWGGTTGTSFQTAFPAENQWAGRFAIEVTFSGSGSARTGCVQAYVAEPAGFAQLSPCLSLPPAMLQSACGVHRPRRLLRRGGQHRERGPRYDDVLATLK